MGLNHAAIFAKMEELISSNLSVNSRMKQIIDICSSNVPHPSWSQLAALDYDADIVSLRTWIPTTFEKQPAPFVIKGLWFGLINPCNDMDDVWADMRISAMAQYDPDDLQNWPCCRGIGQ